MTTKKQTPSKTPTKKNPFNKFVNFTLTKTDREAIKNAVLTPEKALEKIEVLVDEGYAFKITYDERSGCTAVMMSGEWTEHFNRGCIMSVRHKDMLTAITAVIYQHSYLSLGEDWDKDDIDPFANDW